MNIQENLTVPIHPDSGVNRDSIGVNRDSSFSRLLLKRFMEMELKNGYFVKFQTTLNDSRHIFNNLAWIFHGENSFLMHPYISKVLFLIFCSSFR